MSGTNWLFLTCPARSGSTLLFSLLDNHPDLVVWPFEFRYFQEFFVKLTNDAGQASAKELARHFLPLALRFREETFSTYYSTLDVAGAVDAAALERAVEAIEDRQVTAEEFLREVYDCYARCLTRPPDQPRYNLVKTMIKGFDWRNRDLIGRGRFLSMTRPVDKRYASQRNKFIEKFHCGPVETFDRCTRLFFEMKLAWELETGFRGHPNIMFIEMTGLQADHKGTMASVAEFLDIPFTPSLTEPTFLGRPFGGHFHDPSLNKGGVRKAESRHTPLTGYERLLLTTFETGELPEGPRLDQAMAQALDEEVPELFPEVTPAELEEIRLVLQGFRTEVEKLAAVRLMDQSYTEWKLNYPGIQ